MDQDDGPESWQDDIWLARQILAVQSEPVPLRVQCLANQDSRFCVFSLMPDIILLRTALETMSAIFISRCSELQECLR